jgi:hypothetical protein
MQGRRKERKKEGRGWKGLNWWRKEGNSRSEKWDLK